MHSKIMNEETLLHLDNPNYLIPCQQVDMDFFVVYEMMLNF